MIKFNGGIEITFKDLIWLIFLVGAVIWNVAIMPQQIVADVTPRFASKERTDMLIDRLDRIEQKVDKLIDKVSFGMR